MKTLKHINLPDPLLKLDRCTREERITPRTHYVELLWRIAVLLLALSALILIGTSAWAGTTRLPPEYRERYEAVERCLGVDVKNPKIQFRKTKPCPTSGNLRCMAGYAWFQCGSVLCGASGLSIPWENRIELPDEYTASMEHEAVHDVLWKQGDERWDDHSHPAFAACGHR